MSTLRILGIVEDGSVRADEVPPSARSALRLIQGAQTSLDLSVVTPDGNPFDLETQTNLVLTLTARRTNFGFTGYPADLTSLGTSVPATGVGRATFTIAVADTSSLTPGVYAYDLWLTSDELGRTPLIPTSALHVAPAVGLP